LVQNASSEEPSHEPLFFAASLAPWRRASRFTKLARQADFVEVDPKTKRMIGDGGDFLAIYPLGMVPVIRTDDGERLTENAAVLQYIADHFPEAGLAPSGGMARSRLHQWLCFIGTELHKALFIPLLDPDMPAQAKDKAAEKGR
jgi:glutathione S-transferase